VAPAISPAICDATGVMIRDLPFMPEQVSRELQEEERGSDARARRDGITRLKEAQVVRARSNNWSR